MAVKLPGFFYPSTACSYLLALHLLSPFFMPINTNVVTTGQVVGKTGTVTFRPYVRCRLACHLARPWVARVCQHT